MKKLNNNVYYMFERDLTSNQVSYHFCFKTWENFQLSGSGKLKKCEERIFNIFEKSNLLAQLNNSTFHKAITPENEFIKSPYFHMSMHGGSDEDYLQINDKFFIKCDYKYNYFTKLIKNLDHCTEFKCGFRKDEFKKINHDLKTKAYEISKLFDDHSADVLFAFDFTSNGDVINDNINIEILPKYSTDTFISCKNIIQHNFAEVNKNMLNNYDKIFTSYYAQKFHFHIKIKIYKNQSPTVKIYRTYNSIQNPYM
jgi:hypothetical protein